MNRRPGVTLIEVLVAIFVVALGLLALLTLFPLGALSMAQAIKDDRIALTASNAVATLKIMDVNGDTTIQNKMGINGATPDGPSNAVLFDPIGAVNYVGNANQWVGNVNNGIPRVTITSFPGLNQAAFIHGWFTSLDDMTFTSDGQQMGVPADDQGQPAATSGGAVQRDGRYSWAALLRRPMYGQPATEVSIVVYNGRSTNLNAVNFAPAGETALTLAGPANAGTNVVTVTSAPDLRPGAWILDATPAPGHGYFYRVTGVTPNGNNTDLELETPLRITIPAQVIQMDYVAEVIEKGVIAP
jgi:prepilin-type N-terminal cleavage/methylation domain-containing protein